MNTEEIIKKLQNLERYNHRVCNDGDGYVDDWASPCTDGEYVLWADVKKLISDLLNVASDLSSPAGGTSGPKAERGAGED
jgi:hypothetical protein